MTTVGLSGRGLGRLSSNHVPELYFGLESEAPLFTLLMVQLLTEDGCAQPSDADGTRTGGRFDRPTFWKMK